MNNATFGSSQQSSPRLSGTGNINFFLFSAALIRLHGSHSVGKIIMQRIEVHRVTVPVYYYPYICTTVVSSSFDCSRHCKPTLHLNTYWIFKWQKYHLLPTTSFQGIFFLLHCNKQQWLNHCHCCKTSPLLSLMAINLSGFSGDIVSRSNGQYQIIVSP